MVEGTLSGRHDCPHCGGQGEIVFVAVHHQIEDRPANGSHQAWPCPECNGQRTVSQGGFRRSA